MAAVPVNGLWSMSTERARDVVPLIHAKGGRR